jgi:hypothetical protein
MTSIELYSSPVAGSSNKGSPVTKSIKILVYGLLGSSISCDSLYYA